MIRVVLFPLILSSLVGCGVGTPTFPSKAEINPKVDPKPDPPPEVYDKIAPMPREAKPK